MKILLALILLSISACGFEPLYVEKKSGSSWYYGGDFDTSISTEMAQIKIQPIPDRIGQLIRNELTDLLTPKGTPKEPKYRLHVTSVTREVSDQALRSDITATRKRVTYRVSYYMTQDSERILSGNSSTFTGFDVLANPYSTTIAQKAGDEDAARIIANDIALRIGAYFHSVATKRGNPHDF